MVVVQPALLPGIKSRTKTLKTLEGRRQIARFLLLGAGLQSTTLAYMVALGELPRLDAAIFADTKDEPWWVYQTLGQVRHALGKIGVPLIWTHRDPWGLGRSYQGVTPATRFASLPLWVKNRDGSRGLLPRQCTSDYKVDVNNRAMRLWLADQGIIGLPTGVVYQDGELWQNGHRLDHSDWPPLRVPSDVYVEIWLGMSADEPLRLNPKLGLSWQHARYPLAEMGMTRADCRQWLLNYGLPIPGKSACVFCPYRSDNGWLWMKTHAPDTFEQACAFDDFLRSDAARAGPLRGLNGTCFLHESCVPLREVDFELRLVRSQRGSELQAYLLQEEIMADRCGSDGGFSCMT